MKTPVHHHALICFALTGSLFAGVACSDDADSSSENSNNNTPVANPGELPGGFVEVPGATPGVSPGTTNPGVQPGVTPTPGTTTPGQPDPVGTPVDGAGGATDPGNTNPGNPAAGGSTSNPTTGGSTGMGGSQGGTIPVDPVERNCEAAPGLISDFEEGQAVVVQHEDRTGLWEAFSGGGGDNQLPTVEQIGDQMCDQYALRFQGQGYQQFVGMGITLKGAPEAPEVFDASQWQGISFRARSGGTTASPVRFNLSTPASEGQDSGGDCDPNGDLTTCYNHVGRFLDGDLELTSEWQTYNFCFDRDLYPLFLPIHLDIADRNSVASSLLKVQFQFNKAKDTSAQMLDNGTFPEYDAGLPFDIYVDDLAFTNDCNVEMFQSEPGSAHPFPQNESGCELPANVERYNLAVSDAYLSWKEQYVRSEGNALKVISPEQNGDTVSEAMGYGMLIAAAMGDKTTFDGLWSFTQTQLEGNGLMRWKVQGGSGSATDADQDIAYALLIADAQWGGSYAADAGTMISAIFANDVTGGRITPGSNWNNDAYNPSYFAPSFYRAFDAVSTDDWSSVVSNGYQILSNADARFGGANGLVPDWTDATGNPKTASDYGAAVTSTFCQDAGYCDAVFAFDAARVPWRIGMDACDASSTEARSYLNTLTDYLASQYLNGARIDLLQAGWKNDGKPVSTARENQMSFIGPVGVGAMGSTSATRSVMLERSLRALLDIIESPEYNQTYYPTTVGLISLLVLTGNMPSAL